MKVNNNGISNAALTPKPPASGVQPGSANAASGSVAAAEGGYTPSPELTRLIDLVREHPEIREDRVREVSERLKAGYYSTPESIDETANAILSAND